MGLTGGVSPTQLASLPINHNAYYWPSFSSRLKGQCEPQSTQQSFVLWIL